MKKFAFPLFVSILLVMGLACSSPSEIFATSTPVPTNTPTLTPTPVPTNTPVPTPTPVIVPGVDTFVYINDVGIKFFSGMMVEGSADVGDATLTPNPGYSVLILKGLYTGDAYSLFNFTLQTDNAFYVDDGTLDADWVQVYWDNQEITIGFFAKNNASQYILRSTIGSPWEVDLSPFLK